ncbi:MAG: helix-turn-helix domain-containing protein [Beduini sp.]
MESFNNKLLGERLRTRRKELKITQQTMAEAINTSIFTISKIENGTHNMSFKLFIDICNYLQIDPAIAINGISLKQENYLTDEITSTINMLNPNSKEMVQEIIEIVAKHSKS